jgi:hypothetical protein
MTSVLIRAIRRNIPKDGNLQPNKYFTPAVYETRLQKGDQPEKIFNPQCPHRCTQHSLARTPVNQRRRL